MMNFDNDDVRLGFKAAFGFDIKDLTVEQAWWLVKVIKHCRGRCRNNVALNNYLSRNFPGLEFREETVTKADGDEFETLKIAKKVVLKYIISKNGVDLPERFDDGYDARYFMQDEHEVPIREWSPDNQDGKLVLVNGPFTIRSERR